MSRDVRKTIVNLAEDVGLVKKTAAATGKRPEFMFYGRMSLPFNFHFHFICLSKP